MSINDYSILKGSNLSIAPGATGGFECRLEATTLEGLNLDGKELQIKFYTPRGRDVSPIDHPYPRVAPAVIEKSELARGREMNQCR